MQSSKRTLRSHEIPISGASFLQITSGSNATSAVTGAGGSGSGGGTTSSGGAANTAASNTGGVGSLSIMQQGNSPITTSMLNAAGQSTGVCTGVAGSGGVNTHMVGTPGNIGNVGIGTVNNPTAGGSVPLAETELDLNFSLQYPHFIKRDGNRCV